MHLDERKMKLDAVSKQLVEYIAETRTGGGKSTDVDKLLLETHSGAIRFQRISDECAEELAHLVKGMLCHINLIPVNNVNGTAYQKSKKKRRGVYLVFFRVYLLPECSKHLAKQCLRNLATQLHICKV